MMIKLSSPFECQICGKSFSTKTNLNRHEKNHSEISDEDKFICPECGRAFIRKHDLCRHIMARHSDMSSECHLCSICGKAFARPGLLKKHMESHEDSGSGSEKFICHHCCVTFTSKKFLENHIQSHNGKRTKPQKKLSNKPAHILDAMHLLEPFIIVKKSNNKSSSQKVETLELDEEHVSSMAEEEIDDLSGSTASDVAEGSFDKYSSTGNRIAHVTKIHRQKNWTADEDKTEEICPDQFVIDYVKSRMIEAEQDSHRQQFLLSLMPDIRDMSNSQFRNFRQQVCCLIDRILQTEQVTPQASSSSPETQLSSDSKQCLIPES